MICKDKPVRGREKEWGGLANLPQAPSFPLAHVYGELTPFTSTLYHSVPACPSPLLPVGTEEARNSLLQRGIPATSHR